MFWWYGWNDLFIFCNLVILLKRTCLSSFIFLLAFLPQCFLTTSKCLVAVRAKIYTRICVCLFWIRIFLLSTKGGVCLVKSCYSRNIHSQPKQINSLTPFCISMFLFHVMFFPPVLLPSLCFLLVILMLNCLSNYPTISWHKFIYSVIFCILFSSETT